MNAAEDKWITVDKRTGKLLIRYRVKGIEKQQTISSGLKDNLKNRAIVRLKRDAIENDIKLERYDYTRESYQFKPTRNTPKLAESDSKDAKYNYDLQELWEKFTNHQTTQLEETTIKKKYGHVGNTIAKFPTRLLHEAPQIRDWVVLHIPPYSAFGLLGYLGQCCEWAMNSGLIPCNPFAKLKIAKPKRKSTDDDDHRAFNSEQRDLIIKAFESDAKRSHYAPLIKFLFLTGCRHGEAFALLWGDVNDDFTKISITKSCNFGRIRKGTKNGKRRVFATASGSKLQKLLLSIKPEGASTDSFVFTSKSGKPMTSDSINDCWNESSTSRNGKTYRYPGVVKELVGKGRLPYYLKPYATRHTFATLALAEGLTVERVAYLIGDEPETVHEYYYDPNAVETVCPDF